MESKNSELFPVNALVLIEEHPVMLADRAQDAAGDASGQRIVRDVLCHDAARADDAVLSNAHTRHDDVATVTFGPNITLSPT